MASAIVAVAARVEGYGSLSWVLFVIATAAYPVLWVIFLVRCIAFPRLVLADLSSHRRGPTFLTIVAATGVLGDEFGVFHFLTSLVPFLCWFGVGLWVTLVYAFLCIVTVSEVKPDLEHGLNGSWLLLPVATESLSLLFSQLVQRSGNSPALTFMALAFYLLGAMLYVLIAALVFFRWVFRPMHPEEIGAPWWINSGAVAIATLAGARLMLLHNTDPHLARLLEFIAPFTVLLWATSSFWMPLLALLFLWKEMHRVRHGYDAGLWSAVFPLGMYVAATHEYAAAARLPFLEPIPQVLFWLALLAWVATFLGMGASLVRTSDASA